MEIKFKAWVVYAVCIWIVLSSVDIIAFDLSFFALAKRVNTLENSVYIKTSNFSVNQASESSKLISVPPVHPTGKLLVPKS